MCALLQTVPILVLSVREQSCITMSTLLWNYFEVYSLVFSGLYFLEVFFWPKRYDLKNTIWLKFVT